MTDALPPEPSADLPPRYGGFYNRMIASMIDLGMLFIVTLPIVNTIMAQLFEPIDIGHTLSVLNAPGVMHNPPKFIMALWNLAREQRVLERLITENLIEVLFIALYTLPFWFRYSATPGKMIFGLQIRDAATGARMTRKQAVKRFLGYIVSALSLSMGFVWISLNKKRRGFHDLIAGTVVVVKPRKPEE